MSIKLTASIVVAKLLIKLLRFLNLGGTTLPGKIALKIYPDILTHLSGQCKVVVVTGTNGKTTTTKIIEKIVTDSNMPYFTNKSGANLTSGVTTTFISASDLTGKISKELAIIEIDEAAFASISHKVMPSILVVTNFFRDQLDRYGELYATVNNVLRGINNCPDTTLVLNADDSLCSYIGKKSSNKQLYFGISSSAASLEYKPENSDARYCIFCKEKYEYNHIVFGHLGSFHCTNCGFSHPANDVTCDKIYSMNPESSEVEILKDKKEDGSCTKLITTINLPGLYNIYNALAATTCAGLIGISPSIISQSLSTFEAGFGRMETIQVTDKKIQMILVKNPTGFSQVLSYLKSIKTPCNVAFLINDNLADGTDISWLWDVDFELLSQSTTNISKFYTSGTRGEDMSVRLKYAGIYKDKIDLVKNYKDLLDKSIAETPPGSTLFILPTYTALLDIRKLLSKRFGLKEFWK